MIESIAANSNYIPKVSTVTANPAVKTTESEEQQARVNASQVPKTDQVEISEQAREAMKQSIVAAAAGNSEKAVQARPEKQQTEAAQTENTETARESSAEDSGLAAIEQTTAKQTPVLSTLSESDIAKLVSDGVITKAEQEAELAKRNQVQQQETMQAGTDRYGNSSLLAVGTMLDVYA